MATMKKHWRNLPVFAPQQAEAAANDPLSIVAMKAWRLREPTSGRSYTVVKLESRGRTVGFGEGAAVRGPDLTAARSVVVGRRATDAEFIRHSLTDTPAVEAAVNNAMLDLMGRAKNVPIYQYLGGPTRYKARVLARLEGDNEDALVASLRRSQSQGFRAFSFPIPGRDDMWRMQAYTDAILARFNKLKAAAGEGSDFVLDAGSALTPGDASFIATALERKHLLFLDEPTPVLTNDALSRISDETVMPVGHGRHVHDVATFQNLLRWGCVDILRPDVGLNSIPKIRRMAAVAETHYVAVGPHHNGGPIASVAAIHVAASLPNFFIQQIPQPSADADRAMRAEITSGNHETAVDGFTQLLNKPGLGIDVNEQALGKYSEETI